MSLKEYERRKKFISDLKGKTIEKNSNPNKINFKIVWKSQEVDVTIGNSVTFPLLFVLQNHYIRRKKTTN